MKSGLIVGETAFQWLTETKEEVLKENEFMII